MPQTKIAVPGMTRPRSGDHPPQGSLVPLGPLRFHEVDEHEPGGRDLAHPVPERAVVLDVRRPSRVVLLDVRRAVEVRVAGGEPARPRVVGEGPPHGVGRREDEPAARPQHAGGLRHDDVGVRDERHDAVCREDRVEGRVGEGEGAAVALRERHVDAELASRLSLTATPVATMPADRSVATTVAPWATSQREHWPEPAPISRTTWPAGSPSRRASSSRRRSGPQTKSVSPRNDPCST